MHTKSNFALEFSFPWCLFVLRVICVKVSHISSAFYHKRWKCTQNTRQITVMHNLYVLSGVIYHKLLTSHWNFEHWLNSKRGVCLPQMHLFVEFVVFRLLWFANHNIKREHNNFSVSIWTTNRPIGIRHSTFYEMPILMSTNRARSKRNTLLLIISMRYKSYFTQFENRKKNSVADLFISFVCSSISYIIYNFYMISFSVGKSIRWKLYKSILFSYWILVFCLFVIFLHTHTNADMWWSLWSPLLLCCFNTLGVFIGIHIDVIRP